MRFVLLSLLLICTLSKGNHLGYDLSAGANAATIVCGSGTILYTAGVQQNITCTNIVRNPSITPVLPKGLYFEDGAIRGSAVEGSPMTEYTIVSKWNSGTFTLGGRPMLHS